MQTHKWIDYEILVDNDGVICDSCNYLETSYTTVPWGDETAKVCLDCYLTVTEEN